MKRFLAVLHELPVERDRLRRAIFVLEQAQRDGQLSSADEDAVLALAARVEASRAWVPALIEEEEEVIR